MMLKERGSKKKKKKKRNIFNLELFVFFTTCLRMKVVGLSLRANQTPNIPLPLHVEQLVGKSISPLCSTH